MLGAPPHPRNRLAISPVPVDRSPKVDCKIDVSKGVRAIRFPALMSVLSMDAGHRRQGDIKADTTNRQIAMDDSIKIDNRGDFGLWAIEVAKQIVSEQGFELARAARDGTDDELRVAGNALGQAITNALIEVYDGLLEGAPEE